MERIQFYFNPKSRARIVHWALEEVGAEYDLHTLDWERREQKSPEFLKINPMGKLPTIVDRGVVVTESAAICAYLADAYPERGLAPSTDDPKRGAYYRWMFFSASCIEQAITDAHFPRSKEVPPSTLGYGTMEDLVSTLKQALSDENYLLGESFTMADLLLCTQLHWGMLFKGIQEDKSFQDYVAKCQDRPSFKRHLDKIGPMG
ncbi:MAG: glutathione S-transferase family protein [Pseudomonadota bacterium]